jgi:hypothetical protein
MIIAYLHPSGIGRYDVSVDGEKVITGSRDPELDLARALLTRNVTGKVKIFDAATGKHRTTVARSFSAPAPGFESSRQSLALPDWGRAFRQVSFWRSARQPTERMNSALPFCPSLIQPTVAMNCSVAPPEVSALPDDGVVAD